jgi:hypothetical protein
MKHLKLYYKFINENLGQKTKFYHLTEKHHLQSLLSGIDINKSLDRGQGSGFYVLTDLDSTQKLKITSGFGMPVFKNCDLLIEIESVLNEDNFDIDYELVKELPELINNLNLQSKFNKLTVMDKGYEFTILVDKTSDVNEYDFSVEGEEIDGMYCFIPKCNKPIRFGFYPNNLDKYQDAQNVAYTTYFMNTLDDLGIKSLIEKQIFSKIGSDGKVYALRYVGPSIKPTRYKLKDHNGKWSDWKENI